MWTSLADLGIGTVIVRRVTSGHGDLERLVRINSGLSLIYCVPLAAVAALCGLLIYRDASDSNVRIMLVVLSGQLLMLTMTTRFQPVFHDHRPILRGGALRRGEPGDHAGRRRLPGGGAS